MKILKSEWLTFALFVAFLLFVGFVWGFNAGMKHPSAEVKHKWCEDIRAELDDLTRTYQAETDELKYRIELRDSIIVQLKREVVKEDGAELPIRIIFNFDDVK